VEKASSLTYEELTRELFPRLTGGIRWGLERTEELLERVGNPHHAFRSIHVGGTNGKGSVAASLAAILAADGRHTGLYTSPHLCTFRERIQIDGEAIGEHALLNAAQQLWPHIQRLSPSFFEATTAIGFLALAEAGVEMAVIEVGLGGRLDATNVITPELSIITNIAFDHADYLGNTIESIAREKAGIIKPGVPVLTAERDLIALGVFAEAVTEAGSHLYILPDTHPSDVSTDLTGTQFRIGCASFETPLIGMHQAVNAAMAVNAASLLEDPPRRSSVVAGLQNVRWPGRLQVERFGAQTWLLDVAHNVAGVQALVGAIERLDAPRPLVLVIGILGDKDWQAMLPPLFAVADTAILTLPPTAPANRAWDPASVLSEVPFERAEVVRDFRSALERAAACAGDGTVLVTGSFHTVGDALIMMDRTPFGTDLTLPHIAISG
jgi:dihydrofolate synthase / folylpolyglutamate synthase